MNTYSKALDWTIDSLQTMRLTGRKTYAAQDVLATVTTPAPSTRPVTGTVNSGAEVTAAIAAPADSSRFEELRRHVLSCTLCPHLAATRASVVFGVGNLEAELMFVGEAPGADEDAAGEPFVGKAGQILTKMIVAMGFRREDVFIANVLKCRPNMPKGSSGNRKPTADEMATCLPYLREQIALIRPHAIVALGAVAMEGLFGVARPVGALRGNWHDLGGTPVMPTYHPAYLLRNQAVSEKRKVWEDLLSVLELLEKPISPKQYAYFKEKS